MDTVIEGVFFVWVLSNSGIPYLRNMAWCSMDFCSVGIVAWVVYGIGAQG